MILIFGGTTEGRLAVKVADEAGNPYFYSTRGDGQTIDCRHGERLSGALDLEAMKGFCTSHDIRLLVDAAHPFAERLHATIHAVAKALHLPVVRVERRYAAREASMVWCDSYREAMERMEADKVSRVLLLTGVQTLSKLRPFWSQHSSSVWARVLDREESRALAQKSGFPEDFLLYYKDKGSNQNITVSENVPSGSSSENTPLATAPENTPSASTPENVPSASAPNTVQSNCRDNRSIVLADRRETPNSQPDSANPNIEFSTESVLTTRKEKEELQLFAPLHLQAILTKESGESGGFMEKCRAAQELGLKVYVVKRPTLPVATETVTGEFGLRKAIEQLVPGFFPLRSGFTTGSCATSAAKAALWKLLSGDDLKECRIELPNGEVVKLPVASVSLEEGHAIATVVKDAGDDPDVTNGCVIGAKVGFSSEGPSSESSSSESSSSESSSSESSSSGTSFSLGDEFPLGNNQATDKIHFLQGEGVGRITLPGIGLPVGEPAINPVPRQMIVRELSALYDGALEVEIFVPEGRALAQRTFNPKLGILDGISILGTSGIVRPFSSEAFVEAIRREVEVCMAVGSDRLVINSGAKSEAYVKQVYPTLPPQAFVHYGNFIGETLKVASELGIRQVTMGIMLGKAVKLAEGFLDTHSKKTVMNKSFLCSLAREAGCSPQAEESIEGLTLARELWEVLSTEDQSRFFPLLLKRCHAVCAPVFPSGELTILLISEEGEIPFSKG